MHTVYYNNKMVWSARCLRTSAKCKVRQTRRRGCSACIGPRRVTCVRASHAVRPARAAALLELHLHLRVRVDRGASIAARRSRRVDRGASSLAGEQERVERPRHCVALEPRLCQRDGAVLPDEPRGVRRRAPRTPQRIVSGRRSVVRLEVVDDDSEGGVERDIREHVRRVCEACAVRQRLPHRRPGKFPRSAGVRRRISERVSIDRVNEYKVRIRSVLRGERVGVCERLLEY